MRPAKGLGAMQEQVGDLDDDGQSRKPVIHAHGFQQFRVSRKTGTAIDPQCLVITGNDEQQSDAGIGEDIGEAVQPVVAGAVRDGQCLIVQNSDKASRIAAWADIGGARVILRANAQERRAFDEGARMWVELGQLFLDGQIVGRGKEIAQSLLVRDVKVGVNLKAGQSVALCLSRRWFALVRRRLGGIYKRSAAIDRQNLTGHEPRSI